MLFGIKQQIGAKYYEKKAAIIALLTAAFGINCGATIDLIQLIASERILFSHPFEKIALGIAIAQFAIVPLLLAHEIVVKPRRSLDRYRRRISHAIEP